MNHPSRPPLARALAASLVGASVLAALVGCDRAADARSGEAAGEAARARARRSLPPYREVALTAVGRVTGVVEVDGAVPADSSARPAAEHQAECGVQVPIRTIQARGARVANVIVWLEGVRAGKPLPLSRRFTLEHSGCLLVPRAQAAIAGGTLNVANDDRITHRTNVTPAGHTQPIATLDMSFEGQVVPLDRALADPGLLEIACTVHPWARAYVRVFDHPYFVATGPDGSFALDSVPPGRYALIAWHERLGEVRDSVTVQEGGEARVTLRARAQGPGARVP